MALRFPNADARRLSLLGGSTRQEPEEIQNLLDLAAKNDVQAPKRKKPFSFLNALSRVLNIGTATVAGGVRGALRPDQSVLQGIGEGIKKNIGFREILTEDLGYRPKTAGGKVAGFLGSTAADILLDPLTYVTFGTSAAAKLGGKALSKGGEKLFTQLGKAGTKKGLANELLQQAAGKKGIADDVARQFVERGAPEQLVTEAQRQGGKLFDKGGIKYLGRTVVPGATLAKTPVGKGLSFLRQTTPVAGVETALRKAFQYGYGQDPKALAIIEQGARQANKAKLGTAKKVADLFKGTSKKQQEEIFGKTFALKKARAAGVRPTSTDPRVQQVFNELFTDPKTFAKFQRGEVGKEALSFVHQRALAAGIPPEKMIENYIPSKFRDTWKDYLQTVRPPLTTPKRGYRMKFKGVDNEKLVRDPVEAYADGFGQVAVDNIKDGTIQRVAKAFGREFKNADEAARAGFKRFSRGGVDTWIPEDIHKQLSQFVSPEAKTVNQLAKATGFDYMTNLFKGLVTAPFPAFHGRNIPSNVLQSFSEIGLNAFRPDHYRAALKIVRAAHGEESKAFNVLAKGAKAKGQLANSFVKTPYGKLSLKRIKQEAERLGLLEEGLFSRELGQETSKEVLRRGAGKIGRSFSPLSRDFAPVRAGRRFGSASEDTSKLAVLIANLTKGKSFKEGVQAAENAIFNYGKITPFWRDYLRRAIPFVTFGLKNARLQFRTLTQTPGRIGAQLKFFKNLGGGTSQEDYATLPEYMQEQLSIKTGTDKEGLPTFISGLGTPIEEFANRFSGNVGLRALAQTNPSIKFPLEFATGLDFFRERPIKEVYSAGEFAQMPEPIKKFLEVKPVKKKLYRDNEWTGEYYTAYVANPEKLHVIRNLPSSRFTSTFGRFSDPRMTAGQQGLKFLTGVREYAIDPSSQQYFKDRDYQRELEDLLTRYGVTKQFTKTYVPKNP